MKRQLIWLAVLAIGLLMVLAALTPPLNPPQCPGYATRMPDGSPCIIGANIGAGLIWLAGMLLAFVGLVGSVVFLVSALWEKGTRRR